jgi:multiple sugar transport system substrate-binding protein
MSKVKSRFNWVAILALIILPLLSACGGTDVPATAVPVATDTPVAAAPAAAATDTPVAAAAAATDTVVAVPASPTVPPTVVAGGEGCAANAPKVTWYVGLGTGADADQIPKEKAWVDNFNKSQTDACVLIQIVHNPESYDTLKAQLAAGTGPDIVGPVGKAGRASFQGSWADIAPLAQKAGFDLTKYDPALLDFTKDEGVLVGIPFALFPSFIFYNKALFDEAKLPYPPHKVGDKYDGKDWNLQTFQELAQKLTVDANGTDATDASFDAKNIKQFGFYDGPTDARGVAVFFGGGVPYAEADPKTAKIPDNWKDAFKWYYDSVWKLHIAPNDDYQQSDLLKKGAPWPSGNVAMSHSHTWWTCCFELQKMNWDIAVMPTVNGKITAKLHGDTFAILKQSKNQDAAFKVLSQMIVAKDLFQIYGGIPATVAERPDFFKSLDVRVAPNKVDWTVAEEMLKYPDIPNHEAWLPNLIKANDLFGKFRKLMDQTPNLDMDKEITNLQSQLDTIFKEAPKP